MGGIIGITGSPGTGKKTVSPIVARRLKLSCVSLNELAQAHGIPDHGEVDARALRRRVIRDLMGPAVVHGHLLPYVVERKSAEKVVVLRCEPTALKERLLKRGYPPRKVTENVEAELIGVVSADSYDAFGREKTFEVDTTRSSPNASAAEIVGIVKGGTRPPARIDWTQGYDSGAKLRSLLSGS